MQLNIDDYNYTIFEWIPYYQFDDIKELTNETHLAKWKDGPLSYSNYNKKYTRVSNIKVILKYLVGSQNITFEFLNEIIANYNKVEVYGISQDPDTKYYIIILNKSQYLGGWYMRCEGYCNIDHTTHNIWYKWCKHCQINWLKENFTNWNSENKQTDNLTQEMQIKISNTLFAQWIPYYKFYNISKELCNATYSARWKVDGLSYNYYDIGNSGNAVILKYLVDPQNLTYEFLDEVIAYYSKVKVYGISQNPDTKYYIIIFNKNQYLNNCCIKCGKYNIDTWCKWCKHCQISWLKENFTNWTTNKNKQIDILIQEMQLKINNTLFAQWIPYYQFGNIEELSNATYIASWNDDDYYDINSVKVVILKYLVNLTCEFLDEFIANYSKVEVYGISQNPVTKYYIIIFNKNQYLENICIKCGKYTIDTHKIWCKWCKYCQKSWLRENFTNYTSENKQIDDLIQEMQLKINDTLFAKWIPYYQFYNIKCKELCNAIYSARWKDDLSCVYHNIGCFVILKYLVNPQNITYELLDKIIAYYNKVEVYGISQDPDTKYYIIIFNKNQYLENYCVKCEKFYTNTKCKWCKPCQINWLKENVTNWTSENKQINNNIIQEIQLKINDYNDTIFEWIPYYQIVDIEDLSNTIYSAKWKGSPLYWNGKAYTRNLENKAIT
ncbi:unnamed protein product [Rhizophagus irregularis]|nr:unnamed protein product [Rhizophagus irregularis]